MILFLNVILYVSYFNFCKYKLTIVHIDKFLQNFSLIEC